MIYKFTSRAKEAIEYAQEEAVSLGHNYVGSEHILYGLIKEGSGVAFLSIMSDMLKDVRPVSAIHSILSFNASSFIDIELGA